MLRVVQAASGLLRGGEASAPRWAELLPLCWLYGPGLCGWQWKLNIQLRSVPYSQTSTLTPLNPRLNPTLKWPCLYLEAQPSPLFGYFFWEVTYCCRQEKLFKETWGYNVAHSTVRKNEFHCPYSSNATSFCMNIELQISVLSLLLFFCSWRPLPHLVQRVETSELMMSWWWFHLKSERQALFTVQDSSPTMETEWLISSWASLWQSLPWFLGASKILTSLFSQHPCWDAVIGKTRKTELSRALKLSARNWNLI